MSERPLRIPVEVLGDDAVRDLQRIGREVQDMGRDVERASDRSERGFRGVGRSAEDLADRVEKVGTAVGTIVGALSLLGQQSRDHEREVDGLRRAYGDSADQILAFTEAIQDATNFSNDQARQAALTASTLVQAYGFEAEAVETLIARTADLAQVRGFDLQDATQRVTAAMRGEAEAAEALGLVLNDSAVAAYAAAQGIDFLAERTSQEERAAIRFQYFMEQSAYAVGAAGEAAEGAAGRGAALRDWLDDTAESAGRTIGPVGEFLAVAGDLALAAPLAGAALSRLVTGFSALGSVMLGPAGLVIAAASSAVGGIALLVREMTQQEDTTYDLTAANEVLIESLNRLATAEGRSAQFFQGETWLRNVEALEAAASVYRDAAAALEQGGVPASVTDRSAEGLQRYAEQVAVAQERLLGYVISADQADQISALLASTLQYQGEQWDAVSAYVNEAIADFERGRIDAEGLIRRLNQIPEVALAAAAGTAALGGETAALAREQRDAATAVRDLASALRSQQSAAEDHVATVEAQVEADRREGEARREATEAAREAAAVLREDVAAAAHEAAAAEQERVAALIAAGNAVGYATEPLSAYELAVRDAADGVLTLNGELYFLNERQSALASALGEHQGNLNDIEAAYEILQARQAAGEQLSQRELEFLAEYDQTVAGVTRRIEDQRIELGLLAAQEETAGEQRRDLNQTLGDTNEVLVELTDVMRDVAAALDGLDDAGATLDRLKVPQATIDSWRALRDAAIERRTGIGAITRVLGGLPLPGPSGATGVPAPPAGDLTGGPYGAADEPLPRPSPVEVEPFAGPTTVTVTAALDARPLHRGVAAALREIQALDAAEAAPVFDGDAGPFERTAQAIRRELGALDRTVVDPHVDAETGAFDRALAAARSALDVFDRSSATVDLYANTAPARAAMDALKGFQGSAYLDVYLRNVIGGLFAGGGVVAAAANGTVVRAGELAPEAVFPPGRPPYLAARDGLYVMEPGTYVRNGAATNAGGGGGRAVALHFHGDVYVQDGRDFGRQIRGVLESIG